MDKLELTKFIFEAMSENKTNELLQYLDTNVKLDFPGIGEISGDRMVARVLGIILKKYSFLKFTIDKIVHENDSYCVFWHNKGQLKDNNENYENVGITLVEFADDKIKLLSDYFKDTSFVDKK